MKNNRLPENLHKKMRCLASQFLKILKLTLKYLHKIKMKRKLPRIVNLLVQIRDLNIPNTVWKMKKIRKENKVALKMIQQRILYVKDEVKDY